VKEKGVVISFQIFTGGGQARQEDNIYMHSSGGEPQNGGAKEAKPCRAEGKGMAKRALWMIAEGVWGWLETGRIKKKQHKGGKMGGPEAARRGAKEREKETTLPFPGNTQSQIVVKASFVPQKQSAPGGMAEKKKRRESCT